MKQIPAEKVIELAKQSGFEVLDCGDEKFIVQDVPGQENALVRYTDLLLAFLEETP